MASYRRGPPLVRSSGGIAGKHWHPHTRRCDRSGLDLCMTSKGVVFGGSVEVGRRLQIYWVVTAASPQNEDGSLASASRVWIPSLMVRTYRSALPACAWAYGAVTCVAMPRRRKCSE